MTEASPPPEQNVQPAPGEWDEAGFPVARVRELFVTFAKALRAFQLYDENNPVYQRFVSGLRDEFRRLWDEMDRLRLKVEESELICEGVTVYKAENRSESLAWLLYKDGVREVIFLPAVEDTELEPVLRVLQRARALKPDEDDLLTILWEADLDYFRYSYIDILAEGVEIPEIGDGADPGTLQGILEAETPGEESEDEEGGEETGEADQAPSQQTVSKEDFNPTLYSLDPKEMEYLQEQVRKEMARDLRADVLAALFDRLEEPGNTERQTEIVSILRTLLPNLLSRGALDSAAQVLEELRRVATSEGIVEDQLRKRMYVLLDEVSSAESIQELVGALEDGSMAPSAVELAAFLRHLRADALGPLLRASEVTEVREIQPILQEAVQGIAGANKKAVVDLLGSSDPVVAAGAARISGRMQIAEAANGIVTLLAHGAARVRLAAVEAARSLRAPSTTDALQATLNDPEREVRIEAARALGELRYAPAAPRFREIIEGKELRQADITEKIAVFESYGLLGDDKAPKLLDGLLNGRGFLGRKETPEIRAAAALALGKIGTPEAMESLQNARDEQDPVIRSAVGRALRGGEEA